MRTDYGNITITLGTTQLFGPGWYFTSPIGGDDDLGWSVLPLVDNGSLLEHQGGESGSRVFEFCKDFTTYSEAATAYETLRESVVDDGDANLIIAASSYTMTFSHAAVAAMGHTITLVGGTTPFRLSISYTILYTR